MAGHVYKLSKPTFRNRYEFFRAEGGEPVVTADISRWTPGKPDLTLHASPDCTGPVIGVVRLGRGFSSSVDFGLGDPAATPQSVQWGKLTKASSWGASEFAMRAVLEPGGAARPFTWKRTKHVGVGGGEPSRLSSKNWKLLDGEGKILAVFQSSAGWGISSGGLLEVRVDDMGRTFEDLVLVTSLALFVRAKNKQSSTAASAGAAGAAA